VSLGGGVHGTGGRIASTRKLRRMTQVQLAEAAAISVSLLRKIEQGSRPVTPGVWPSIVRALGLETATAVDQAVSAESRVSAATPRIRCALDCYDLPDDGPIVPLADLRAATEKATARRLAAHYASLADTLPGLISELTRAAHGYAGRDRETAFGLLALAYRAADALCDKFGYPDLSARTIELMAGRPHDPMTPCSSAWRPMCVPRPSSPTSVPLPGCVRSKLPAGRWPQKDRLRRSPSTDRCTCARASWLLVPACQRRQHRTLPKPATSAITCRMPSTVELPSAPPACGYMRSQRRPRWETAKPPSIRPPGGSHHPRCPPNDAPITSSNWRACSFGLGTGMMRWPRYAPRAGSLLSTPGTTRASTKQPRLSHAWNDIQAKRCWDLPGGPESASRKGAVAHRHSLQAVAEQ
jgi:transcriptional regulator with XRE-family HTH domain